MRNTKANHDLDFAQTDYVAQAKFSRFGSFDPFPEIAPALLNTADIADYIAATGMVCPFNPERLKSASYEMLIGDQVLYWDNDNRRKYINLSEYGKITLYKNSITFVTVDATFRVPDYIALRFNLQIEHVHRGLLLGTGPLINPGFVGNLMIPIHNLTENDYSIKKGDPLIGVEFTKISSYKDWQLRKGLEKKSRKGVYICNKMKKNEKTFLDYLSASLPFGIGSVKSSLSSTLSDSQNALKKIINFVSSISAALLFAILALILQTWNLINDANKYVSDAENHKSAIEIRVNGHDIDLINLQKDINKKLADLNTAISHLTNEINSAENKISNKFQPQFSDIKKNLLEIEKRVEKFEIKDENAKP